MQTKRKYRYLLIPIIAYLIWFAIELTPFFRYYSSSSRPVSSYFEYSKNDKLRYLSLATWSLMNITDIETAATRQFRHAARYEDIFYMKFLFFAGADMYADIAERVVDVPLPEHVSS